MMLLSILYFMPEIQYKGESVECEEGEILRDVLLEDDMTPHNGITDTLNCGGHGTCGTCAIRLVEGSVKEDEQSTRLKIATHDDIEEVRLACQYEVTEDIVIEQP